MFGLFKKKKQQTEALIEKDEHSGSDNGAADIAARTASNQATQIQMQKAAQTFAKPSQYTGIINKNQIYIIMESQYKVCEVKLTYKSKIKASEREKILSAENAYKILLSVFDSETIQYKEFFKVILMNRANKVLGVCHISEGGLNETSADIRIIMQAAILGNASAIILAHNHPSGNIQPSMQDDQVTKRVKEIAKLIGINLLDHLIITDETYYSYSENGRI